MANLEGVTRVATPTLLHVALGLNIFNKNGNFFYQSSFFKFPPLGGKGTTCIYNLGRTPFENFLDLTPSDLQVMYVLNRLCVYLVGHFATF